MTPEEIIPDEEFAHLLSPLALAITATAETPSPYSYASHLHLLSNELVQLVTRAPNAPRRLMVTMPPRHGKSEMCSHWLPVWALALDPRTRIVLCSYEAEFAAKWGRLARRSLMEHYPLLGARITEDSRAAHRWETHEGGGMVTAGVGGPITGRGGHILILDDPIKNAEEAMSQRMRDNLWEWWTSTFLTRLDKDAHEREAVVVFIMTRWHEDDLAGRILASDEAKYWRHLNLPALAEDDDELGRAHGAALWPEKFDELALERKHAEVGSRVFSALYQQHPTPPEGSNIHRAWWRWYDEDPHKIAADADQVIQSWDPTFDNAATSDYAVGQVWARKGSDFYYLDCIREKMNTPQTIAAIHDLSKAWPQARKKLIEKSASGFAIYQLIQREVHGLMQVGTKSRSKDVRLTWGVNSIAAVIERGQVFLPRGGAWSSVLVDEAAQFPHAVHDDMVDAMVQALTFLMPRGWVHENLSARERKNLQPTDNVEAYYDDLRAKVKKRLAIKERESKQLVRARQRALRRHAWL